jgi:2-polyprenyl-3-methyl-5-hydroxy-6-metoxy-1,4-benzoquinol methylase
MATVARKQKKTLIGIDCILCKKKRTATITSPAMRDADAKVVQCTTCKLVQMERIPSSDELNAFYNTGKQAGNIGVSLDIANLWERQRIDTQRRVVLAGTLAPKGARVLDIGSGYGFFLREMKKKGYRPEGIEVSELSRSISASVVKAPLHAVDLATMTDADLKKLGTFKLITLFHVVEHIPEPATFLKHLRSLLAPGGKILIEVPNADDAMLGLSDAYNAFYWQYAHCAYYNAHTMTRLLKQTGFKNTKCMHTQRYGIENMMQWMMVGKPQLSVPAYATDKPDLKKLEEYYKADRVKTGHADTLLAIVRG